MIRAILTENYSKEGIREIVALVEKDKAAFQELMDIFLNGDKRSVQQSSWALTQLADTKPELLYPYLDDLVESLKRENIHDAVKRNTVRVFERMELPERLHGEIVSICFDYLADPKTAVAIKCFSMTTIWNICAYEPDLAIELELLIEEQMDYQTNAFKNRGKKILKAIQQKKSH